MSPIFALTSTRRRWTAWCWILGPSLLLLGIGLRPEPVEVAVHAADDPSTVYWTGHLAEPAIRSGVYFHSILVNRYPTPPNPLPERVPFRVSFRMHLLVRVAGARPRKCSARLPPTI